MKIEGNIITSKIHNNFSVTENEDMEIYDLSDQ